jgi:hypothetical protein
MPQNTRIHSTVKLTINFPRNAVSKNFYRTDLEMPRSLVIISTGRTGIKDTTKVPNDRYLASNNRKEVIRIMFRF